MPITLGIFSWNIGTNFNEAKFEEIKTHIKTAGK
jgi:hypothetical protein